MLTKKQLDTLRKRLLEEREKIIARYNQNMETQERIGEEAREPQDLEDMGQMTYTEELLSSLSKRDMEILKEIEHALKKMEDGTYGICEESGEEIPYKRLLAIPWTRYTAKSAENYERESSSYEEYEFEAPIAEDLEIERDDIGEA